MAYALNVFDPLFCFAPGDLKKYVPRLATKWEIADDYIKFKLREGVKFHDGTPFNAEAVKFTIDRIKGIGMEPTLLVKDIQEVIVHDEYNLTIKLKGPSATFQYYIPRIFIVSPEYVRKHATNDDPWAMNKLHLGGIGTGPYKHVDWIEGDRVIFDKFDDYWGGWEGNQVDRWILRQVFEASTRTLRLETGQIDMALELQDNPFLAQALVNNPNVTVDLGKTLDSFCIYLNMLQKPLDNVKVRQALSYAFDYDGYLESVMKGFGSRINTSISSSYLFYNPNVKGYEYDLDKARELLTEAGYPDGGFKMSYLGLHGREAEEAAGKVLQDNLKKLGIEVSVEYMSWAAKVEKMSNPETAASCTGIWNFNDSPGPSGTIRFHHGDYTGKKGLNWSYYDNPRVNELYEIASKTSDYETQEKAYWELQERLKEDAPAIYLMSSIYAAGYKPWVSGYYFTPGYTRDAVYVYDIRIDTDLRKEMIGR